MRAEHGKQKWQFDAARLRTADERGHETGDDVGGFALDSGDTHYNVEFSSVLEADGHGEGSRDRSRSGVVDGVTEVAITGDLGHEPMLVRI